MRRLRKEKEGGTCQEGRSVRRNMDFLTGVLRSVKKKKKKKKKPRVAVRKVSLVSFPCCC